MGFFFPLFFCCHEGLLSFRDAFLGLFSAYVHGENVRVGVQVGVS